MLGYNYFENNQRLTHALLNPLTPNQLRNPKIGALLSKNLIWSHWTCWYLWRLYIPQFEDLTYEQYSKQLTL